jgi:hypothetical protein
MLLLLYQHTGHNHKMANHNPVEDLPLLLQRNENFEGLVQRHVVDTTYRHLHKEAHSRDMFGFAQVLLLSHGISPASLVRL